MGSLSILPIYGDSLAKLITFKLKMDGIWDIPSSGLEGGDDRYMLNPDTSELPFC